MPSTNSFACDEKSVLRFLMILITGTLYLLLPVKVIKKLAALLENGG